MNFSADQVTLKQGIKDLTETLNVKNLNVVFDGSSITANFSLSFEDANMKCKMSLKDRDPKGDVGDFEMKCVAWNPTLKEPEYN